MESSNTNEEYFEGALPLAEPHFDEEATVLSARPVVPLKELRAERSVKRLLFGLAMAGSLMLGVLAATLIYKRSGSGESTATGTVVSGAAGITVEEPIKSAPPAEPVGGTVPETLPPAGVTGAEKKVAPSVSRSAAPTVIEAQPKKASPQIEEADLTREERIEARRLKRRAERQARRESAGRQRRSGEDLLRIRDIFEGPVRP